MDGGEPGISYTYLLQHRVSQKVVSRIMSQKMLIELWANVYSWSCL